MLCGKVLNLVYLKHFSSRAVAYPHIVQVPVSENSTGTANDTSSESGSSPSATATTATSDSETPTSTITTMQAYSPNPTASFGFYNTPSATGYIQPYPNTDSEFFCLTFSVTLTCISYVFCKFLPSHSCITWLCFIFFFLCTSYWWSLTLYHTILTFNYPKKEDFGKYFGKRRKCW